MTRLAFPLALAAGALCVATAAQAQGYKFSPPSTTFTASGPAAVTKDTQLKCTMTMKMRTNAKGHLKILSTKFTDGCATAENLPWKVKQPTFNSAMIIGFEFASPFGDCSYPEVPMLLDAGIVIVSFQFPDCGASLGAELTTSPTLSLVPKGTD